MWLRLFSRYIFMNSFRSLNIFWFGFFSILWLSTQRRHTLNIFIGILATLKKATHVSKFSLLSTSFLLPISPLINISLIKWLKCNVYVLLKSKPIFANFNRVLACSIRVNWTGSLYQVFHWSKQNSKNGQETLRHYEINSK